MKTSPSLRILILTLLPLFALLSPLPAQEGEDDLGRCQRCHGESWIASMRPEALASMVRVPEGETRVFRSDEETAGLLVSEDKFLTSAHGGLSCTECHIGIERLPHNQRLATLSCADCHEDAATDLAMGPHGQGDENGRRRPNCTDCHGNSHEVLPVLEERTFQQAKASVDACSRCHDESDHYDYNPVESYTENIHGRALLGAGLPVSATCADCHGAHKVLPPDDPESPLHPLNAPDTCGRCHQGIEEVFFGSVHGQHVLDGDDNAASCTSCHHSHGIEEVGEPFLLHVVEECSTCHLDLGQSYMLSYHGKAATLGYGEAAVCSSCHGAHDILPASNPESHVHEENLVETCGKCHEDINKNFTEYISHVDYTDSEQNLIVFITFVGMTTLLLGTLTVFLIHTLLWFNRIVLGKFLRGEKHHKPKKGERMVRRFDPIHRITHGLIIISFMGLVITGFPLKYSYTEWAHNFTAMFGGIWMMGLLHRIFAIMTFGYTGIHLFFLAKFFWKECPRPRWRYLIGPDSMLFSPRDLRDVWAMIKWFFFLGPKPRFERWTYFEKFDYFGEIWGVIVIGGSGLLLWMPELFTRWLPGWFLNVAMVVHSIEALLAASVIFLVHFFNTHLRPEKFPVDTVMLTGQMPESEFIEERGQEYQRLVESGKYESRIDKPVSRTWQIVGTCLGICAFSLGILLIILAIKTEWTQFFG